MKLPKINFFDVIKKIRKPIPPTGGFFRKNSKKDRRDTKVKLKKGDYDD